MNPGQWNPWVWVVLLCVAIAVVLFAGLGPHH